MSIKDRVAPHLPYLRRYARALTGSQTTGDAYVRACLEALLSGRDALEDDAQPRVALYKLFHRIWAVPGDALDRAEPGGVAAGLTPEDRLRGLGARTRQALLLSAVENFAFNDVAAILGVSRSEAERLAEQAQHEIERELATDVLVIEDEAIIAMDIKDLAEELGHRVTAIARTRAEAVAAARARKAGLVLADIQLADDSSGIDAVKDILELFDAPVVFVTAFPERLLTGDRPEPAYLLTKPFERLTLKATIGQALFFHRKREAVA
jgi:DNA-directed RNA polymerase specialized sigma24 family protein